ncbi:hypothetical protein E8E11_009989 [Didymella keratinophila]|nr:hypothetical protein E8E11_009989 [Didymella keratinophila]
MAIGSFGRALSRDLLRIEISAPDRPHLTIVELPGLIHSETKQQSSADVELVQDVVKSYMKEPHSIILAVVSAKNDYANQIVLKLARAADKTGTRTLGVITKPDTLVQGSASERLNYKDLEEQRLYLLTLSQAFQSLTKAAVDGTYNNDFFGDIKTNAGYQKRIRAVIQNLNQSFAETMAHEGHHYGIANHPMDVPIQICSPKVKVVTRTNFLNHIEALMKRSRGCELPGTFNPMIILDLFREQSRLWEDLARKHLE